MRAWFFVFGFVGCATAAMDDPTPSTDAGPQPAFDAGPCRYGLVACDAVCVDVSHDDQNCGACGKACPAHFSCVAKQCKQSSCLDGTIDCSGACIDPKADPNNCGACGNACGQYGVCVQGKCALDCQDAGLTACTNTCVDTSTDDQNCGKCSNVCPKPSACDAGACDCGALALCNNQCVDLMSASTDCGKCGNTCSGQTACVNGQCVSPPAKSVVFVSSAVYEGGQLNGLSGADALCQTLAKAASLSGTFKAWLSDSKTDVATRLPHWPTPYVLPSGTQIASDWSQLVGGSLAHAIDQTETQGAAPKGSLGTGLVWTNTNSNGTKYASACSDWTSTNVSVNNWHFGNAAKSASGWTLDTNSLYAGNLCQHTASLYCIGN